MISKHFESLTSILKMINEIFTKYQLPNAINIFLCGGASRSQSEFRFALGERIDDVKSSYVYKVYYPETLFAEISGGHNAIDLLSLENVLASSVTTIVIPLESPGTFAELGAFSNNSELLKKLVLIVKPKYKNKTSFINSGPLKKIKKENSNHIIYSEFDVKKLEPIVYKITEASRNIYAKTAKKETLRNPITAMIYYMLIVYLFDPISEEVIKQITKYDTKDEERTLSFDTALSTLESNGYIILVNNSHYSVVKNGFEKFLRDKGYSISQIIDLKNKLEKMRLVCINWFYRRNRSFWGKKESALDSYLR